MRLTRGVWCCALALAACKGSDSGTSGASGANAAPTAPTTPPPPRVALLRCAPARPVPVTLGTVAQATDTTRTAGILGNSALLQGGAFASLTGTGDISSGLDDKDILGGLTGDDTGDPNIGLGFGRRGFGPGGGGTGTIGTGKYGTISGNHTGQGYGIGGGRGGMHGRTAAVPQVHIGQPSAAGDLDKAIIRRYIKRNTNKLQYCYEKELLARPGLHGTVSAQFFITPDGTVGTATASGVDPTVASCVADVIRAIEFPKPKGGGGVQVNYPFVFEHSDDAAATASAAPAPAPAPVPAAPADVDAGAPAAPPAPAPPAHAWTPYALGALGPDASLANATVAVQAQVQARLGAIDGCFGAIAGGTVRAMLAVDRDGVTSARVGGLGKPDVEACVARELGAIKLAASDAPAEIACDLSRGPEASWRVTPDGYDLFEVSRTEIKHGGRSYPADTVADRQDPTRETLVVVDPDATGVGLHDALDQTAAERAVVVAIRDRAGGAPIFVATAPGGPGQDGPGASPLRIILHADTVELCSDWLGPTLRASTTTRAALDDAFRRVAAACGANRCGDAAVVDERQAPDVAAVVTVLDHARAAGFTRIALGVGSECAP